MGGAADERDDGRHESRHNDAKGADDGDGKFRTHVVTP
jgi:hypothetical protein